LYRLKCQEKLTFFIEKVLEPVQLDFAEFQLAEFQLCRVPAFSVFT
jgi:hypothetical protein